MTTLDATLVQGLRAGLRGPVLVPGDPGYDETRAIWNAMIDRRPALIARCIGVSDVLACVRFAREHSLALSMRGGGHNIAGLALAEGGLMLDLSLMRGVWVDPAARLARAQGGCLLGDVDRETQLHGLAAALGFVSATGIGGLTLGGGFGYLSRRFGWTSDTVRSMDLVTADGRQVRASEKENADLFWGLRGGGGNFGVVTGIEYELQPVGPEIVGGPVAWRAESAPEVLEAFRKTATDAPPELTLVAVMRKAPPAPWIDKSAHGQLIVHAARVLQREARRTARSSLAPLKALGKPVGRPAAAAPLRHAAEPARRHPAQGAALLLEVGVPARHRGGPAGEAAGARRAHHVAALGRDRVPAGRRDRRAGRPTTRRSATGTPAAVFNIAASWEKPEDDAANVEWARSSWRDMKRFSTGGTYVNFLTEEETGDRVAAAYGGNLRRLAEIKARWDPDNLFRMNKNIPPSGAA